MKTILRSLLNRFDNPNFSKTNIIPWSSPVPSFGDPSKSIVATVGLNPSNREFEDIKGKELDGDKQRRFHTLTSLKITRWSEAKESHLRQIINYCENYFSRNPYYGWFKKLDDVISGTRASYRNKLACHLDLVPYATEHKWGKLKEEQSLLLTLAGDSLAHILKESSVRLLILNGKTVVENFEKIAQINFEKKRMASWTLPRKNGPGIRGYSYKKVISKIANVKLKRRILVLGFNHYIQNSRGATNQVKTAMRNWVTKSSNKVLGKGRSL